MKLLKSRLFAAALAVAVVCGSTLMNTSVKLGERSQEAEDSFYSDVSGSRSVYTRLDERLSAANGLWTIAEGKHNGAAIDLSGARSSLLDAMEDRDISAMYDANAQLQSAFDAAVAALSVRELTDSESSAMEDYVTAFAGAQKMIDESNYNAGVLEFERSTLNKFPASLLAPIVGVEGPELFA